MALTLAAAVRARLAQGAAKRSTPADQQYRKLIQAGRGVVSEKVRAATAGTALKQPSAAPAKRVGLAPISMSETMPARTLNPIRVLSAPGTKAALVKAPAMTVLQYVKQETARTPVGYKPRFSDVAGLVPRPRNDAQRNVLNSLKKISAAERATPDKTRRLGLGLHPVDIANGALNPERAQVSHNPTILSRFVSSNRKNVPGDVLRFAEEQAHTTSLKVAVKPISTSEATVLDDVPESQPVTTAIAKSYDASAAVEAPAPPMQWAFLAAVVFVAWLLLKGGAA